MIKFYREFSHSDAFGAYVAIVNNKLFTHENEKY